MIDANTKERLKRRCLAGDDDAWRELYGICIKIAQNIALAPPFLFDPGTADDIAEEALIELTQKLEKVDNITAFAGSVAHHKCVDRVRKKKEIPLTSYTSDEEHQKMLVENMEAPPYLPDKMEDNSIISAIREFVAHMGKPCSQLLRHRFFDELSYAEVAVRNTLPASQAGMYISRCLGRLRDHLGESQAVWVELRNML